MGTTFLLALLFFLLLLRLLFFISRAAQQQLKNNCQTRHTQELLRLIGGKLYNQLKNPPLRHHLSYFFNRQICPPAVLELSSSSSINETTTILDSPRGPPATICVSDQHRPSDWIINGSAVAYSIYEPSIRRRSINLPIYPHSSG